MFPHCWSSPHQPPLADPRVAELPLLQEAQARSCGIPPHRWGVLGAAGVGNVSPVLVPLETKAVVRRARGWLRRCQAVGGRCGTRSLRRRRSYLTSALQRGECARSV